MEHADLEYSSTARFLLLVAVLGPVLYAYENHKAGTSKARLDGTSLLEIVLEALLRLATKIAIKAYQWVAARTRGASVFTLSPAGTGGRVILAGPAMERVLGRHVDDTSLAHNIALVGQRMFDLSDETVRRIGDYDPRLTHRLAFSRSDSARALFDAASDCTRNRLDSQPDVMQTPLGPWMFKLMCASMTTAVWGPTNPWSLDDAFAERFMSLTFSLPTLLRPLPQLTARKALNAREDIIASLRTFHSRHRHARIQQLAHRINLVSLTDPSWESNPDYFRVELLTAQGLVVTPSAMATWLMRHLLSAKPLMRRAVAEVRALDDSSPDLKTACPTLVASLHETLRLHMTGIPRVALRDFDIPLPSSPGVLQVRKGDIILLPMSSFNRDPATWGPDVASFNPNRFLVRALKGEKLSVSDAAVRKLRTFGVASNMCPGRKLGFDAVLFVVAAVLREFNVEPLDAQVPQPVACDEPSIGFERVSDDVDVTIRRVTC